MISFGKTDVGRVRSNNQDNFLIENGPEHLLAVVCDGMGGHRAGEVAAKLATEKIREQFIEVEKDNPEMWLNDSFEIVNKHVFERSITDESCRGMGTTMVAALINDQRTYIGNTGDSRAYILTQDDVLVQITFDHSLITEIMRAEGIDYERASSIVPANIITQAIGIYPSTKVDVFRISSNFKMLMLSTDGLHGYVGHDEIRDILITDNSVEEKVEQLINAANRKGGLDNITVVLVEGEQ
ncbi:MAG: Stp1/IreP family PP2C-type Ser/Thr phosphatase [Erysipelotrichaceae bacterium]|nr:Stp1/IreP family PP2C-type Ser/Thr phosphatase [Erysipelotrichaceae bacterium]